MKLNEINESSEIPINETIKGVPINETIRSFSEVHIEIVLEICLPSIGGIMVYN